MNIDKKKNQSKTKYNNSRTTEFGGSAHDAHTLCVFYWIDEIRTMLSLQRGYDFDRWPAMNRINKITCKFIFIRIYEFEIAWNRVSRVKRPSHLHTDIYSYGHFNWIQLFQFAYKMLYTATAIMRHLLADAKHHESHHITQCTERIQCVDHTTAIFLFRFFSTSFHWSRRVSQSLLVLFSRTRSAIVLGARVW